MSASHGTAPSLLQEPAPMTDTARADGTAACGTMELAETGNATLGAAA